MSSLGRLRITIVGALLWTGLAGGAAAQVKPENPLTGKRVRVTAPNFVQGKVTGTVVDFGAEGLVVLEEGSEKEHQFPLQSISMLEPYKGGSRGSTAWYRARLLGFVGLGAGLIAGPFLSQASNHSFEATLAASAGTGLLGGAAMGATWGFAFPKERWSWIMQPWGYDKELRPTKK